MKTVDQILQSLADHDIVFTSSHQYIGGSVVVNGCIYKYDELLIIKTIKGDKPQNYFKKMSKETYHNVSFTDYGEAFIRDIFGTINGGHIISSGMSNIFGIYTLALTNEVVEAIKAFSAFNPSES
jgi:hypothetical protein